MKKTTSCAAYIAVDMMAIKMAALKLMKDENQEMIFEHCVLDRDKR